MKANLTIDSPRMASTPRPALKMSVSDSFEALDWMRAEWDRFVAQEGAGVWLSFDGLKTWWSHYGYGRTLHLLVFRVDGEIIGILPLAVQKVWLGPVWVRLAAIVGTDSTLTVQAPPVRRVWAREAFAAMLGYLFSSHRCDAVKLSPLCGSYERVEDLRGAIRDRADVCSIIGDSVVDAHTVFELPRTFDEYLASLTQKQRQNYRRAIKVLRGDHGLREDVLERSPALAEEFPRFVALHAAQWHAERKLGHFEDWPKSEQYHADLVRAHSETGRAHLLRMFCDGEIVSYQLCYALGDVLHWVLPARSLRPELERHSLGRLGLIGLIEFAIGAGFKRIEAGLGHYDYKLQLGATEYLARSVVISANRPMRRLRLRIFALLSKTMDLAYYRIWFQRLAPRLPLRRRPLWPAWIRSRL
jgi:CelD/BcsL family acetyltransferase involved in cellulose biosynthesis